MYSYITKHFPGIASFNLKNKITDIIFIMSIL